MERQVFEMDLAGRTLSIETGRLAKQASGSALVKYGETVVLVTAVGSPEPREGIDFFPLTVDYEERMYAVGKIPGGFIKREGRPSEKAILSDRLIDRPIRPLFPEGYRNDVHIVLTVLSVDQDNPPEIAAMIGASAALTISHIPFLGPIAGVIVGRVNGELVINPNQEQTNASDLHLVVAGTKDAVMMVEAGAEEVPEDIILEAIMFGHDKIKEIVMFQEDIQAKAGKEKQAPKVEVIDAQLEKDVQDFAIEELKIAIRNIEKHARENAIKAVKDKTQEHIAETYPEMKKTVDKVLSKLTKKLVRGMIVNEGIRPDGRKNTEIRPISSEVGILPRTHGSGLFTRGQTQALTVATLGSMRDAQILDGLGTEESKRYIHHYNFPPFSVGEARFMRGPGRRDIGHGALAERALLPLLPTEEAFPYAIRLVSEVLESNGSSSMASVCGSTLSLMDAGVPIKAPVSGVAMGLIKDDENVVVLTDIQGMEDHLGDMDFKVAGTEKGITAIQMDIKIAGISRDILATALKQAYEGRIFILKKMLEVIAEPRAELSLYAPRIITITVHPDKIRTIIGPGGKTIKKLIEETGVDINIEDDGRIFIATSDSEAANKVVKMIEALTAEAEVGKIYMSKVTRLMDFGAFAEILPGKEGLIHISQLAEERVNKVDDVVAVGDQVLVKVIKIDDQGRINLSRKAALKDETKQEEK